MKILNFFVASVIFIAIIATGLKLDIGDVPFTYIIPYFDKSISLPTWLWIVIPTIIYFVFASLYIIWFKIMHYWTTINLKKEKTRIYEIVKCKIMGKSAEDSLALFGNFKQVTDLLATVDMDINASTPSLGNKREIDVFISDVKIIKSGGFVDKKMFLTDINSRIVTHNIRNHIISDIKYALSAIEDKKMDLKLRQFAFIHAINAKAIELKDLKKIIKKVAPLTKEDYLYMAKTLNRDLKSIDDTISVFRDAYHKGNQEASFAYLYLLLDLEMNKEAEGVVDTLDKEDEDIKRLHMYMVCKSKDLPYTLSDFVS